MEFDEVIASYLSHGYRLEMIFPADAPRVAELSRGAERVTVESESVPQRDGAWHVGRAGMEYRDLLPDRCGGRLIASHIRIRVGGPIPDYVHYHDIGFQIIYCLKGSARLVYEDQGEPFEFRAGDCVLQPPKIRHRVLECSDGFEVFEVGSPAENPTFAEHSFDLPTGIMAPDRWFGSQQFLHHRSAGAETVSRDGFKIRRTGICRASAGAGDVYVVSSFNGGVFDPGYKVECMKILFVATGTVRTSGSAFDTGEAFIADDDGPFEVGDNTELIVVEVGREPPPIVQVKEVN